MRDAISGLGRLMSFEQTVNEKTDCRIESSEEKGHRNENAKDRINVHRTSEGDNRGMAISHSAVQKDSENDPDFVSNFFKQSRLHFIGSWKLRHSNIVRKILEANEGRADVITRHQVDRYILHIDMDCFFAAVAIREEPQLKGLPIAICHASENTLDTTSTSEISAASYEARKCGIRAGMFLGSAYRLCPALIIRGYRFDLYESITSEFFSLLLNVSTIIEPVSCDEVYMDITHVIARGSRIADVLRSIKDTILERTGCVASIGCGRNKLLAKLASKKAKPDGIVDLSYLGKRDDNFSQGKLAVFMRNIPVTDLPGVGYVTSAQLQEAGLVTCGHLADASIEQIERTLGYKSPKKHSDPSKQSRQSTLVPVKESTTDVSAHDSDASPSSRVDLLRQLSIGLDRREVTFKSAVSQASIGAEINYGIRFRTSNKLKKFMYDLSKEVATRMENASVLGKTITLKVKRRKEDAPKVTTKYLGETRNFELLFGVKN